MFLCVIVGYTKKTMDHCEMRQRELKRDEIIAVTRRKKDEVEMHK